MLWATVGPIKKLKKELMKVTVRTGTLGAGHESFRQASSSLK